MAKSRSNIFFDEFSELVENIIKKKNISVSFGKIIEKCIEDPKKASKAIQTIMEKHVDPAVIDSMKVNGKSNRIDIIINNWKSEEEIVELKKKSYDDKILAMKEDKSEIDKSKKKKNENLDKTIKYQEEFITTLIRLYGNKDDKVKSNIYSNNIKAMITKHPGLNDFFDDFMSTRSNIISLLKDVNTSKTSTYEYDIIGSFKYTYLRERDTYNLAIANLIRHILHDNNLVYKMIADLLNSSDKTKHLIKSFECTYSFDKDKAGSYICKLLMYIFAITPEECNIIVNTVVDKHRMYKYLIARMRFPNDPIIQKIIDDDVAYLLAYPETGLYPEGHPLYDEAVLQSQKITEELGDNCIHPYNQFNTRKVGYILCSHGGLMLPSFEV